MLIFETIIALIIVFALLVVFHELGHYLAAKWAGMRVDEFALGFGPKIKKLFTKNGTEFTLRAIPAGGFVNIAGMEPGSEETIPDGFQSKSLFKRSVVIFAGPFASFLLALILFLTIGLTWGFMNSKKTLNKILFVNPNTPAAEARLRAADTILEINGRKITNGKEMVDMIHHSPGKEITLKIKRNSKVLEKKIIPQWNVQFLNANWIYNTDEKTFFISETTKSEKDFAKGDKLISINGRKITNPIMVVLPTQGLAGKELTLVLERNKIQYTVKKTPEILYLSFGATKWYFPGGYAKPISNQDDIELGDKLVKIDGKNITSAEEAFAAASSTKQIEITLKRDNKTFVVKRAPSFVRASASDHMGLIGVIPQNAFERKNFADSIATGMKTFGHIIILLADALKPQNIGDNIGGPVMIATQTSTMVSLGMYYVFQMAALLSLSLAIMNILPIPILDGGHLLLLAVEGIRRRKLTMKEMQIAQMIGLLILAMIISYVMFSDIAKLVSGEMPR